MILIYFSIINSSCLIKRFFYPALPEFLESELSEDDKSIEGRGMPKIFEFFYDPYPSIHALWAYSGRADQEEFPQVEDDFSCT